MSDCFQRGQAKVVLGPTPWFFCRFLFTEYIGIEMKQEECMLPCQLDWTVHCNFVVMINIVKGLGVHPPTLTSPEANFSIMMECTPQSLPLLHCVYSVVLLV
jgi:hypothetical protein